MRFIKIYSILLLLGLVSISCTEEFDCDNYEVLEGSATLNGEKMYPILGTTLTNINIFGFQTAGWAVRLVEDDCELNNAFVANMDLAGGDEITGTFDFGSNVQGQISYDLDEDGAGGTTTEIQSGTIVITEKTEGVYELDVDAELQNGDPLTLITEYKFK